jgi:hypothetical protein
MRTTLLKAISVAASLSLVHSAAIAQSASGLFQSRHWQESERRFEGAIADYTSAMLKAVVIFLLPCLTVPTFLRKLTALRGRP